MLIDYLAFAVIVFWSNPCAEDSPKAKLSLFLFSTCADDLLATQNIITFLTNSPFANKEDEHASYAIPFLEQEYLSGSAFLINVAASNKKSFNVKSALNEVTGI